MGSGIVSAIAHLQGIEGQAVLRRLLESHPSLRSEAEEIARALIGEVSFETIGDDLAWELESRTMADVENGHGRLHPADAAWEVLQEAVDPFIDEMRRRLELGLDEEALDTCRGIILGLYRARERGAGGCLGQVPDFPEGAAENVLSLWRRECPRSRSARAYPPEFLARHVPEWKSLIARAWRSA
jgi:hypothetical protein